MKLLSTLLIMIFVGAHSFAQHKYPLLPNSELLEVFKVVEQYPIFPGCTEMNPYDKNAASQCYGEAFDKYLKQNLVYKGSSTDRAIFQFDIAKDGSMYNINLLRRCFDENACNALVDVLLKLAKEKKWTPGKQRSIPVNVRMTTTIDMSKYQNNGIADSKKNPSSVKKEVEQNGKTEIEKTRLNKVRSPVKKNAAQPSAKTPPSSTATKRSSDQSSGTSISGKMKEINIKDSDFYFSVPRDFINRNKNEWANPKIKVSVLPMKFDYAYSILKSNLFKNVKESKQPVKILRNEKFMIQEYEAVRLETNQKSKDNFDYTTVILGDESEAIMIILKYIKSVPGNIDLINEIVKTIVHKTHKEIQIKKSNIYFDAPLDIKLYGNAEWGSEKYGASVSILQFDTTYVVLKNIFLKGIAERKEKTNVLLKEKIKIDRFEGLKVKTDQKENGNFDLITILFGDDQIAVMMTFKYRESNPLHIKFVEDIIESIEFRQ